ncbi:MAG: ATP-binding protein [Prolixibacteraceae bacterium]|jgi:signal transduction histidine kinase|nr:ATP-binding protein [Prolixibacteraceae bacterium]
MKNKLESNTLLNVLCLEDVLKDAELINEMFVDAGYLVNMDIAIEKNEYAEFLKSRNYDIILSDNSLPNFDAFSALKLALALKPEIPFICVSGTIGEEKAVELLKDGASDYVLKDRPGRLAFAVSCALEVSQNKKEKQKAEQDLISANKELIFQNAEKEKRTEELIKALERAEESDRLKSSFLANMSHEIRTPMNSIMGFASLLPEEESKLLINNYASIIVQNSEHLLHIIDDIVLYSRLQTGIINYQPNSFDAQTLLSNVIKSFNLPEVIKSVDFKIETKDTLLINSDHEKLQQIFTNLISNAYKYTSCGTISIGFTKQKEEIIFFVKDTGIGIPPNELEKVFERFYRASNVNKGSISGTGLGLSIVKELIHLLGGRIWVESYSGLGSSFYFTIPYKR